MLILSNYIHKHVWSIIVLKYFIIMQDVNYESEDQS